MFFGMKLHVGTDRRGIVHSLTTSDAAQADITHMPTLLHGEEREVYGDRAYWSEVHRQEFRKRGVCYRINRRTHWSRPLDEHWRKINRSRSRIRARGEHPFHVVKRLWNFTKVRYRGLAKNTARAFALFALSNLDSYKFVKRLLSARSTCLS